MNKQKYLKLITPAMDLVLKKDQDYNSVVTREQYFPFGHKSHVQMIYVKATRLVNLAESGEKPNFESVRDTALDLINYCLFYLEYLEESNGNK